LKAGSARQEERLATQGIRIVANRILSFIDRVGNHSHLYGEIEKYFIATDDSVIEIDTDYSSHKKRAR